MFVEEDGLNLQNDTKLEMTSCFIAEKMVLDEPLFCTGSLWEAFKWRESIRPCERTSLSQKIAYIHFI